MLLLLVLFACKASPPAGALPGECDASAVVAVDGRLVIASDESDELTIYEGGKIARRIALAGPLAEALGRPVDSGELDLEGVARAGDVLWWTGSHGLSRKGKDRPDRRMLFATSIPGETVRVLGRPRDLRDALRELPELGPELHRVAELPPKKGGLDIEGLAIEPSTGHLLIGLRSPVTQGRAWIVELSNPAALLADPEAAPLLSVRARLDLGGRGVRALTWSETLGSFVLVAGHPGEEDAFGLFRWDGRGEPVPLPADLGSLRPEGIEEMGGELLVVSDDGGVSRKGTDCKDRREANPRDPQVYFRTARLPLR